MRFIIDLVIEGGFTKVSCVRQRRLGFAHRRILRKAIGYRLCIMRMIGHLPNQTSAATFSDFLYVEGITNLVEAEKEGWAIWIHSEDQLQRARELFLTYLGNPRDPKYQKKSQQVAELKQREREEQDAAEKRTYGRSQVFRSFTPFGVGPLTFLLVLVCAAI